MVLFHDTFNSVYSASDKNIPKDFLIFDDENQIIYQAVSLVQDILSMWKLTSWVIFLFD